MKERPILFSAPMVRAILDRSKTQTRRVVKPQPTRLEWFQHQKGWIGSFGDDAGSATNPHRMVPCPYGQPGDRLWVKETFMPRYGGTLPNGKSFTNVRYRADEDCRDCFGVDHGGQVAVSFGTDKWRPSIFMPRWASRITLEITEVRVERLQDIDWIDAKSEGVRLEDCEIGPAPHHNIDYVGAYQRLWESINGPGSWDANPWVWVIEFKRIGGGA